MPGRGISDVSGGVAIDPHTVELLAAVFGPKVAEALFRWGRDTTQDVLGAFGVRAKPADVRASEESMRGCFASLLKLIVPPSALDGTDNSTVRLYASALNAFRSQSEVYDELLRPFLEVGANARPSAAILDKAWDGSPASELVDLPQDFNWGTAVSSYVDAVDEAKRANPILNPAWRDSQIKRIGDSLDAIAPVAVKFDIAAYRARLREACAFLRLEALAPAERDNMYRIALRQVFVEPDVQEDIPPVEVDKALERRLRESGELPPDTELTSLPRRVLERAREVLHARPIRRLWDAITHQEDRRIVIVGDPGSGKSTLARYLAFSLASDSVGEKALGGWLRGCVPFLVELKDYAAFRMKVAGGNDTFIDYLDYLGRHENYALEKHALSQWLEGGGRALFIFDGLDEIFDPATREATKRDIAGLRYPDLRIVVTSRIVGYQRSTLEEAGFTHHTLQDLDEDRIDEFARKWFAIALPNEPNEGALRRRRITDAVKRSPSVRALAGNPMLLTIMAIMARNAELPRERHRIYDHAARVLVEHWDVNKHLRDRLQDGFPDLPPIEAEDKLDLLRTAASWMQRRHGTAAGNYATRADLEHLFRDYLERRFGLAPALAITCSRTMIDQFRERNFALCYYGAGVYGFIHRAFLEYFCASALAERLTKRGDYDIKTFLRDVVSRHWSNENWHEVLRLICGIAGDWFGMRIAAFIANQRDSPPRDSAGHSGIVLAIKCAAECRNPGAEPKLSAQLLKFLALAAEQSTWDDRLEDGPMGQALAALLQLEGRWAVPDLVEIWSRRPHPLLSSQNPDARVLAYRTLAILSRTNPKALALLKQRALHDPSRAARTSARWGLVYGWAGHPGVLELLKSMAVNGEDWLVRGWALTSLAKHWENDQQVIAFLVRTSRAPRTQQKTPDAAAACVV